MPPDLAQAIVDPAAYADGRALAAFSRLRRDAPFARARVKGLAPFWVATRHADVLEIERQHQRFSSGDLPVNLTGQNSGNGSTADAPIARTLVSMDGAEHRAMRQLTHAFFAPANLRRLEPRIRALARRSVDRMAALGEACDFAREIALFYPLRVIMEILGVPEADEPLMLRLTQELFGSEDEDLNRSGSRLDGDATRAAMLEAVMEFVRYFHAMIDDRKRDPGEDLGSVVANGLIKGQPIGFAEAVGYYLITATAGHDTTSNTISMGLWALAERPKLLRRLQADPSLIPGHVEESIRWASSVRHFMRCATEDVSFAGQTVAKGDWIMVNYLSASRDEAVFADPDQYDITRPAARQISFGSGPHVCLGQHLARLEMRIFWEELLPRLDRLELAGEPRLTATTFVGGPKALPVRYTLSPRHAPA